MWRSYVLSKRLTNNVYFLEEDNETKIYGELGLKRLNIPFKGQIDLQPNITQHLREIRAQWMVAEVGDKRIVSQVDELHLEETADNDYAMDALDDDGIMNLGNMMER